MDIHPEFMLEAVEYPSAYIPSIEECHAFWQEYAMPEHIQEHSTHVAFIAETIAQSLYNQGNPICVQSTIASALLHDIAKMHCIHSPQLHHNYEGAVWILEKTHNKAIAQGIYYHNYLPPELVTIPYHLLQIVVMYADSRVMHSSIVTVEERYKDLILRYGKTQKHIEHILLVQRQAQLFEQKLCSLLGTIPI